MLKWTRHSQSFMPEYDSQQFWDDATREHYDAGVAIGRVQKMLERYEREDGADKVGDIMNITEINYTLRKNLGDYSYVELKVSAIVEDGETANASIERIHKLVKWRLNADNYEAKYKKLQAQEMEPSDTELRWMTAYEARKNEIEAI